MSSAILGTSITLPVSGKVVKNRFMKAAMSEHLCSHDADDLKRGKPTEEYIRLYQTWGKGGFGIILSGNIMVHRAHPEAMNNAVIDPDIPEDYTPLFARVAAAGKAEGSLMIGQLAHAGRQAPAVLQPNPVSASDVENPTTFGLRFGKPTPLTVEGIKDVINRFAHAAVVLHKAGWDGAEIHGGHGFLLTQFLSPRTNLRTDQYGGSLENRSRIIFDIVREIKRRVQDPTFSLSIKLNSADFSEGGMGDEECREIVYRLEAAGIDFVELSGGTYENLPFEHKSESTRKREAFFLDFAERIQPNLKTLVLAVTGGFRTAAVMSSAITDRKCDIVGLARPSCAEPQLPRGILEGRTTGARETKVPGFALQMQAAITHMIQLGHGQDPTDYSIQENVDSLVAETQRMQATPSA